MSSISIFPFKKMWPGNRQPQKVPVSMTPQKFYQRFPGSGELSTEDQLMDG